MNSAQTFFCRFYFPRSFPAFIIQFLENLMHDLGRKDIVHMNLQKCPCQQDWCLGGVWMLASACFLSWNVSPQFSPCILVHHLKVWDRNANGQLERSVASFGVTFVLLYDCGFFLLCSLSLLCTWCGSGTHALCGHHIGMLLSPCRL